MAAMSRQQALTADTASFSSAFTVPSPLTRHRSDDTESCRERDVRVGVR